MGGGNFRFNADGKRSVIITLPEDFLIDSLPPAAREHLVKHDPAKREITLSGKPDKKSVKALVDAVQEPEAKEILLAAIAQLGMQETIMASPAERQEHFAVPQMMLELDGDIFPADEGIWLETEWSPPLPPRNEDIPTLSRAEKARNSGIIDVVDGNVVTRELPEVADRIRLIEVRENWDAIKLVSWLDRNIPHDDLDTDVARAWFDAVIQRMLQDAPLGRLVRERFDLRRSLEAVIAKLRRQARHQEYQLALFGEHKTVKVRVGDGYNFVYDPNAYPARWVCKRSGDFLKHYYEKVGELETETEKQKTPEEFLCAQYIDEQPELEWWVRNLDKQPVHSFWLQTSSDRFYPDFVAKLKNGKVLAVEYKGLDRATNDDTKEKERLGKLWEERSGGQCYFEMVKGLGELRKIQDAINKGFRQN